MPTVITGIDSYPTSFDAPADTETLDAASVNVGLESLADRDTYLKNRLPTASRLYVATVDSGSETPTTQETFTSTSFVDSAYLYVDVPSVVIGDKFAIDFSCVPQLSKAIRMGQIKIRRIDNYAGTPAAADVTGMHAWVRVGGNFSDAQAADFYHPGCMAGATTAAVAGTTRIVMAGKVENVDTILRLQGAASLRVMHMKAA